MNIGFLFDLDGVLIDSEREYTRIWNSIEDRFPTEVENFSYRIKGTTLENILSTYFKESDHPAVKKMLFALEQQMQYDYCDGAESLLDILDNKGLK